MVNFYNKNSNGKGFEGHSELSNSEFMNSKSMM